MADRIVSIKITSDGKAFVVDQNANAEAVGKLQGQLQAAGAEADKFAAKATAAARMTWAEFQKAAGMGPLMKQAIAEGATHADAHTQAVRKIADAWKLYKQTGVDALAKTGESAEATTQKVAPLAPKLQQTEAGLKSMGISAAQAANNLRMVPAQITDIVTQLSAGASPMQVFIQQGGQLKDIFGGVGPAVKAVGGYIAGLVSPTSVAIAAAGALAFAWYKGREESDQLTRQIILSGNAAGVSASQYYQMAGSLSSIGATKGAALEALTAIAERGKVAEENLQRFAAIALQLERLVGKPVQDTAREFQALGEAPVTASAKLNQSYNYLTATMYLYIKALEDSGHHTEAARVAQDAFAKASEERLPKMAENLGTLERGWLNVKDAIKGAGSALLDIGRQPTLQQQADQLRAQIAKAKAPFDPMPGSGNAELRAQLPLLERKLALLDAALQSETKGASTAAEKSKAEQAAERFAAQSDAVRPMRLKLEQEITKARLDGAEAGLSQTVIDKQIANIRKKIVDQEAQDEIALRQQAIATMGEVEAAQVKENLDRLAQLYKVGALSEVEYIDRVGQAEIKLLGDDRQRLQERLAQAKQKANSEREVGELKLQIALQDERIDARKRKIDQDQLARLENLRKAEYLALTNQTQQWDDDIAKARAEETAAFNQLQLSVDAYKKSIEDESKELEFQVSIMGQSGAGLQKLIELHRIDIGLRNQLREIEKSKADPDTKEAQREIVRQAAAKTAAEVDTKIWVDQWNSANREVGEDLYLILTGRGKDAAHRLQDLFENLVLKPTIMGILQPVSGSIASALTGGSPGALGSIGTAASLYNGLGTLGSMAGGTGILGAIGGSLGVATGSSAGIAAGVGGWGGYGAVLAAEGGASAAGATAAGAMTSVMGAIPVWGWAALGAAAIAGLSKGGETRSGGKYLGTSFLEGPSGGEINGDATRTAIGATIGGINAMLKALGATATLAGFESGFESSEKGKGFAYGGGTLSTGKTFGQTTGEGYLNRRGSMTPEQAAAAFGEELKQATLQALQAADVPGQLGDYLRQLGDIDKLSGGALDAALGKIQKALTEKAQLEDQIFTLTHTDLEILNATRDKERAAIDESNLALLNQVYALQDAKTATEAAARAQEEATRAQEEAARAAEEAAKEAHRALVDSVTGGTDAAYAALERAVAAQREAAQVQQGIAQEQVSALRGLSEMLKREVASLYGESASAMLAATGRKFIEDAWRAALSTGYLPDQADLADAIAGARAGMSDSNYGSAFEATRDRLVLAGKLSQLEDVSDDQLTTAERQLRAAQDQIKQLDGVLTSARAQIDALRGIDTSVISVRDAIDRLAAALAREAAVTGGSLTGGSTEQWVQTAGGQVWQSSGGAVGVANASGFSVTGKSGITYAGNALLDRVNAMADDPMQAYLFLRSEGISANSFDHLKGWQDGTSNAWADAVGVPRFADGGWHDGGWAMVGERGRELRYMPPSRIFSNAQTEQMLGQSGGDNRALQASLDRLWDVQRSSLSLTNRLVKKVESWDGGGMPPARTAGSVA